MKKLIIRGMDVRYFSEKIVEWYNQNKRSLPWRSTKDPYKIWLSEIILQQTRVNQGLPYYRQFIKTFPNIKALASAREQKVLRLWQGLGYYTRARNLHKCAKKVFKNFNGRFPSSYSELKKLPGIGDYTAAAIASISFHESIAVVDGNVFRVLSRIYGIEKPINSPDGKKYFTTLANKLISHTNPAVYNQAVMEFGALHCTPKNPQCTACIFQSSCFAFKYNLQLSLPVKNQTVKKRIRHFYYFVIQQHGSLLMRERSDRDIWNGLYDFYLIERNQPVNPKKLIEENVLLKEFSKKILNITYSEQYRHVLTHQTILAKFIILTISKTNSLPSETGKFYPVKKVSQLPKPVLISRFLADFQLL